MWKNQLGRPQGFSDVLHHGHSHKVASVRASQAGQANLMAPWYVPSPRARSCTPLWAQVLVSISHRESSLL